MDSFRAAARLFCVQHLKEKVRLLDEPTEGLQPSVVEEIDEIIKQISSDQTCAVLLVEQNLDFVRNTMQDFAILDTGRIVVQGGIDELTDELAHQHLSV